LFCFDVARASLSLQRENQSWKLWIRKRKNVARASLPLQKRKTRAGSSGYDKEKEKRMKFRVSLIVARVLLSLF
jgi:hypothetical protein